LVGVFVFFIGALFLLFCLNVLIRGNASKKWGFTVGTLAQMTRARHGSGIKSVRYVYRYGTHRYEGTRVDFGLAKARADGVLLGKRAGESVLVYFNPKAPKQSVLVTGADQNAKIMSGISGTVCLIGAVVFVLAARAGGIAR
jgi:hypothetical protein